MKRILVTGAAGFIGSHLCERLLAGGYGVFGMDDFCDSYDPRIKRDNIAGALKHDSFTLYEDDIRDADRVAAIFKETQPEVVVHLAARAGVRPSIKCPDLYYRVNILGFQEILNACQLQPPSHFVLASSSSIYGNSTRIPFCEDDPMVRPISPYAASKCMNELQAHLHSQLYGLDMTVLRFFTVYGPRQRPDMAIHRFARLIHEEKPVPMFGDGSTRRDYTYIDDIVDGVIKAVEKPFEYKILNLGGHHTTVLRDLIALIEKHMGKTARIEEHPLQSGDVDVTYANVENARKHLDFAPSVTIEEGIRRFVAWFNTQVAD